MSNERPMHYAKARSQRVKSRAIFGAWKFEARFKSLIGYNFQIYENYPLYPYQKNQQEIALFVEHSHFTIEHLFYKASVIQVFLSHNVKVHASGLIKSSLL